MMYGLTEDGFNRKRLDVIQTEKTEELKGVYGDELNTQPQSPAGQQIGIAAQSDDQLWQIAEAIVQGMDPDTSSGAMLSGIVKYNYIERLEARPTVTQVTLVGTPGVTIPAGQLVSDGGALVATIPLEFTFPIGGVATANAELQETGPIPVGATTLTTIDTPKTGWDSVTNTLPGITGRDRETDAELRIRRNKSLANPSQNMIESLIAAVGNVSGVTQHVVLENKDDAVDANGIPGHSVEVIVTGGLDDDIGQAIWQNYPFGIGVFGTTNYPVNDSQGIPHILSWTRPADMPIFVIVEITKRPGYPVGGDDQMKQAIVDYAQGNLVAGRGFAAGMDVIQSELYTPANFVPAHDISRILIGLSANPTLTDNIPITVREASQFLTANISIVEV